MKEPNLRRPHLEQRQVKPALCSEARLERRAVAEMKLLGETPAARADEASLKDCTASVRKSAGRLYEDKREIPRDGIPGENQARARRSRERELFEECKWPWDWLRSTR